MTTNSAIVDRTLHAVSQQSPLIHNITNLVVMQTTANVLLAMGASPIMSHAAQELEELIAITGALVLNIGTLDSMWVDSMQVSQRYARNAGIPIVLDPVGAGASGYRTHTAKQLLQAGVDVVRGNAGEILALSGEAAQSKGVDSLYKSEQAVECGLLLAQLHDCCVVVSGEADYVCYQGDVVTVDGGDVLLTRVTGMGCSTTSMIAACCAVEKNPLYAAQSAMTCMAQAAERACLSARGPGSFFPLLLDAIYERCRVQS